MDYILGQLETQLTPSEKVADSEVMLVNDQNFSEFFTESQLGEFQSIGNEISKDSTFVLTVVRKLYANDLLSVKKKSTNGRRNGKEPMTPEKLNVLKQLFKQRLTSFDSTEKDSRLGKLTRHINNAFSNISK